MPTGNHALLSSSHRTAMKTHVVYGGRKEERGKVASRHQRKWLAANGILRWGCSESTRDPLLTLLPRPCNSWYLADLEQLADSTQFRSTNFSAAVNPLALKGLITTAARDDYFHFGKVEGGHISIPLCFNTGAKMCKRRSKLQIHHTRSFWYSAYPLTTCLLRIASQSRPPPSSTRCTGQVTNRLPLLTTSSPLPSPPSSFV